MEQRFINFSVLWCNVIQFYSQTVLYNGDDSTFLHIRIICIWTKKGLLLLLPCIASKNEVERFEKYCKGVWKVFAVDTRGRFRVYKKSVWRRRRLIDVLKTLKRRRVSIKQSHQFFSGGNLSKDASEFNQYLCDKTVWSSFEKFFRIVHFFLITWKILIRLLSNRLALLNIIDA